MESGPPGDAESNQLNAKSARYHFLSRVPNQRHTVREHFAVRRSPLLTQHMLICPPHFPQDQSITCSRFQSQLAGHPPNVSALAGDPECVASQAHSRRFGAGSCSSFSTSGTAIPLGALKSARAFCVVDLARESTATCETPFGSLIFIFVCTTSTGRPHVWPSSTSPFVTPAGLLTWLSGQDK